ncbi:MAG: M24 family metallopeptidase [Ekhidna sp.]
MRKNSKTKLVEAEKVAVELFELAQSSGLIKAGKTEKELNVELFELAKEHFNIEKHWHKRIVRSGVNTLLPYRDNPSNLTIREDDILFFDFGPILEDWEADLGRTYVIGNDPVKIKLKEDIESAWHETKEWFHQQKDITGATLFQYAVEKAKEYGWEFGGPIAGHIIGEFPHEELDPEMYDLYVHPENHKSMMTPDENGNQRDWILEIHFVDREKEIGGFFEQLLT